MPDFQNFRISLFFEIGSTPVRLYLFKTAIYEIPYGAGSFMKVLKNIKIKLTFRAPHQHLSISLFKI